MGTGVPFQVSSGPSEPVWAGLIVCLFTALSQPCLYLAMEHIDPDPDRWTTSQPDLSSVSTLQSCLSISGHHLTLVTVTSLFLTRGHIPGLASVWLHHHGSDCVSSPQVCLEAWTVGWPQLQVLGLPCSIPCALLDRGLAGSALLPCLAPCPVGSSRLTPLADIN